MKRPRTLSAPFVKRVRKPGIYGDGHGSRGLSLRVHAMKNGRVSKSWRQRVRIDGRQRQLGLGPYPEVSLAQARQQAYDNAVAAFNGDDPRSQNVLTFGEAAAKVIAMHREGWKHPDTKSRRWRQTFRDYVFPKIGSRPVAKVTARDIMEVLSPIWNTKPASGRTVKQRVSTVLMWAHGQGYRADDPTPAAVTGLPRQNGRTKHHAALPHGKIAEAIRTMEAGRVKPHVVLAFRFIILTACRMSETLQARWKEVDLDERVWTIPVSRSKMKRAHRVPLSDAAMDVLAQARTLYPHRRALIFPTPRGKAISPRMIGRTMKRFEIGGTVHGFRSSFRDWCSEGGVSREVAEMALAHVVKGVEGAYRRTDLLEARRGVMQDWADYLQG